MKMLKKIAGRCADRRNGPDPITACSNAVTEKDIADATSDMAKAEAEGTNVTFTPPGEKSGDGPKTCCTARESFENDSDSTEAECKLVRDPWNR